MPGDAAADRDFGIRSAGGAAIRESRHGDDVDLSREGYQPGQWVLRGRISVGDTGSRGAGSGAAAALLSFETESATGNSDSGQCDDDVRMPDRSNVESMALYGF